MTNWSWGGWVQLVKSVLSSILVYIMTNFPLPKWVIRRIDKIRTEFLWDKPDGSLNGIILINWDTTCFPIKWGGLGIGYLKLKKYNTPIALVVKTIWWTEFALVIDGYGDMIDRSICT